MRCRFSRAQFLWVSVAQGTRWEGRACHYARQACPLSVPPQWCRLLSVIFGCEDKDDDAKDNELIGRACRDSTKAFKCQLWDLRARLKWQAPFIRESPNPNHHPHCWLHNCHFAAMIFARKMSQNQIPCSPIHSEPSHLLLVWCEASKEGLVLPCSGNQSRVNFAKIGKFSTCQYIWAAQQHTCCNDRKVRTPPLYLRCLI